MFKLSTKQLLELCASVPADQVAITAQGTFLNALDYEKHKGKKSVFLITDLKGETKAKADEAKTQKQAETTKVVKQVIEKIDAKKQEKATIAKLDAKNAATDGELDKLPVKDTKAATGAKPSNDKKAAKTTKAAAADESETKNPATRKTAQQAAAEEAAEKQTTNA